MKYYTDQEILDMIESKEVTELVAERFAQKDNQRQWLQQRVNVAAEHMGHQLITDLVDEGY
jgi:hypothetical protein